MKLEWQGCKVWRGKALIVSLVASDGTKLQARVVEVDAGVYVAVVRTDLAYATPNTSSGKVDCKDFPSLARALRWSEDRLTQLAENH